MSTLCRIFRLPESAVRWHRPAPIGPVLQPGQWVPRCNGRSGAAVMRTGPCRERPVYVVATRTSGGKTSVSCVCRDHGDQIARRRKVTIETRELTPEQALAEL